MKSRYLLYGALLNLATLLVGLAVGLYYGGGHVFPSVMAQTSTTPKVEEVSPGMTIGTLAAGLILTQQVEADVLVVNGYDVMKIQQGILNYLATRPLAERADLQNIVNSAKPDTFYKIKPPPAAPAPPSSAPTKNKEDKPK